MKTELTSILSDGTGSVECVDLDALYRSTTRRPLTDISRIEWQTVGELHILGTGSSVRYYAGGPEAGCYLDETGTWALVIDANSSQIDAIINRCGSRLRVLDLRFAEMQKLSLHDRLHNLHTLRLSPIPGLKEIEGLSALTRLRELDLSFSFIGSYIDLTELQNLVRLELAGNPELVQIDGLSRMHRLEELDLSGTAIGRDLDLSGFRSLRRLRLVDTRKLERVYGLGNNPELTHVDLACSGIRRIPEDARELRNLVQLDLSNLKLEELPDWLPELGLNFTYRNGGINLRRTEVLGIRTGFFDRKVGPEGIDGYQQEVRDWFAKQKQAIARPLSELKVMVLGGADTGKSSIIARLLRDGAQSDDTFDDHSRPVNIQSKCFDIGDRSVDLHFWDFSPLEISQSVYRMFMTSRTLYIVVADVRNGSQDVQAKYWLHNITRSVKDAPIILVLNYMDQNPVNEADLRKRYPQLAEILRVSAMHDSREDFQNNLIAALERQIDSLAHVQTLFPPAWSKLKDRVGSMNTAYISSGEFDSLCDQYGVEGDPARRSELLRWLVDLGIVTVGGGSHTGHDCIVLMPDLLVSGVSRICSHRGLMYKNGMIRVSELQTLLEQSDHDHDFDFSDIDSINIMLSLLKEHRFAFRIDADTLFIPMLCTVDAPAVAEEYARDAEAVEFRMEYEYLLQDVIHQLIAARQQELDIENIWMSGARFVRKETGLSAVVMSEANLIRIIVRSENAFATAQAYVDELTDDLMRINESMGLKIASRQIAYKANGDVAYFDYDDLLLSQELEDAYVSSRKHRMKIPVAAILMQTSSAERDRRKRFIQDLQWSCTMLQNNRSFSRAVEDERIVYIRDLLRAKGYFVSDQTMTGTSINGKHIGELDLEIRLEPNIPWTMCEMLNLRGSGASQRHYWDMHLQKIMVNYNPNGLPFLFLLAYVNCPVEKFQQLVHAYSEHMKQSSPERYSVLSADQMTLATGDYGENQYIRMYQAVYDCGGIPTTVYHVFVYMGE